MKPKPNSWFGHWARTVSHWTGRPIAFMLAALLIVGWLITGPIFHYSDTWQLVINTTTTIVTFLMVFLIQNTQNRDTEALQLKLDELIRAVRSANNELIDLEDLDEEDLDLIRTDYINLARKARQSLTKRKVEGQKPAK